MAKDKIEEARRAGMLYAYSIAKDKGVEGLREELRFRNITQCPIAISQAKFDEFVNNVKEQTTDMFILLMAMTLRDEFDFGKDRIMRAIHRFEDKADNIVGEFCSVDDCIQLVAEELKIDLNIRWNNKDVKI